MKTRLLACLAMVYVLSVRGQVSLPQAITITGGGCVNSQLTLTTPVPAQEIDWTLNGTTVVQRQTATLPQQAVSAAGSATTNQLYAPDRLFVDANGTMYIPDLGNNRIVKWPTGASSGIVVAGGNGTGGGNNQFKPTIAGY